MCITMSSLHNSTTGQQAYTLVKATSRGVFYLHIGGIGSPAGGPGQPPPKLQSLGGSLFQGSLERPSSVQSLRS